MTKGKTRIWLLVLPPVLLGVAFYGCGTPTPPPGCGPMTARYSFKLAGFPQAPGSAAVTDDGSTVTWTGNRFDDTPGTLDGVKISGLIGVAITTTRNFTATAVTSNYTVTVTGWFSAPPPPCTGKGTIRLEGKPPAPGGSGTWQIP